MYESLKVTLKVTFHFKIYPLSNNVTLFFQFLTCLKVTGIGSLFTFKIYLFGICM